MAYQTRSSQTGDHSLQQSSQRNLTNYWGFKPSCQQLSTHKQMGKQNGVNQEVEQYLRLFISHRQDDWPEWIATAEFAYNNKVHTAMQVSPFYANYGFNPRMGVEPCRTSKVEAAEDFAKRMQCIHEEAQAALSKARDEMKRYADQHRNEGTGVQSRGKRFGFETDNIDLKRPSKKLAENDWTL